MGDPEQLEPGSYGRPRLFTGAYIRLLLFSFITFLSAFQLFPAIPFRILELGGTEVQAGLFLTAYTWASALAAPLTGALADRFGRRRLLIVASIGFIVFSILYGIITKLPLLLVVGVAHGILWSGLLASSGALITDAIPLSRRTEGIAYWGMAPTAAIAIAPAIGFAVYELGWGTLAVEMALLSLFIAWLATRIEEGPDPTGRRSPGPVVDWRVMVVSLSIFVIAFGYGGVTTHVALLSTERGIEPTSLFFTVFAVTVLLTRIVIAPRADRIGPEALFYPSVLLVPPGLALLARATGPGGIVAGAILFGVGLGCAYPTFMTWLLGRTPADRRAATFGSVLFAMDTAIGSGSLALAWFAARWTYGVAFSIAATVALLCLPVFLSSRRLLPEPPPEQPLLASAGSPTGSSDRGKS